MTKTELTIPYKYNNNLETYDFIAETTRLSAFDEITNLPVPFPSSSCVVRKYFTSELFIFPPLNLIYQRARYLEVELKIEASVETIRQFKPTDRRTKSE